MTTDLLILQALRHSTLTEELRDAEIDALAKLITVRDFKTGDILVQPSESADLKDTLLILGSGEVEADAVVGNDKVKLHMLKPGDLAGIIGFVGGSATQVRVPLASWFDPSTGPSLPLHDPHLEAIEQGIRETKTQSCAS